MLANIIRNRKKTAIGGGGGGIVGSISLDYLIVAGGGSGGSGTYGSASGGGGGAGGVLQGNIGVNVGDTYALTVGTGGAGPVATTLGNNGTNSVFNTLIAIGGGRGAGHNVPAQSPNNVAGSPGGSGGGGSGTTSLGGTAGVGGAGTAGQGNNGGTAANNQPLNGGGGGGAGAAGGASATGTGARAGAGGAGIASNITGNSTYYGGGGGGGIYTYNNSPYMGALQGLGGIGGGGNGGANATATAHGSPGTPNTGGGGGGGNTRDPSGSPSGTNGGSGGSGVVILKCPSAYEIAEPSGLNYSSALSGGNRIYSFYSGTGNVTFQAATTDPYFSSVSLLLHMDGANGSTTFTDNSSNALAVTRTGTPTISTSQSVFGGSSLALNGSSYLTVANNAAIAFGLEDFTIECWVNFSALPASGVNMSIANTMTSPSVAGFANWWLGLYNAAGIFRLYLARHGNAAVYAYSNWTPALNTWYHVAVTRSSGSVISLFVNGVSQSVVSSGSNWANDFSATGTLSVGYVATAAAFNGFMDEFRLTKGVARYTTNFTPPTAAFPNA